jgi:hypothetical protein
MASKTYAGLSTQADVQDGDLLAAFRGTGPLKSFTASILVTYLTGKFFGASGHFAGYLDAANTWSAGQTHALGTSTTAADYVAFKPTDYGAAKPGLFISKTATANTWQITVTDGATLGELDFSASLVKVAAPLSFTLGVTYSGSTKSAVTAVAAASIDVSAGDWFTKSISANTTFTFDNPTASKAQGFILELTISSAAVPTWPASVTWRGGVAPTLGNGTHLLGVLTMNGGTTWRGLVGGIAFS